MITYSELFLFCSLIVSIIALVVQITKKKYPPLVKSAVTSLTKLWTNRLSVCLISLTLYVHFLVLSTQSKIFYCKIKIK